jgi:hypothetical protein
MRIICHIIAEVSYCLSMKIAEPQKPREQAHNVGLAIASSLIPGSKPTHQELTHKEWDTRHELYNTDWYYIKEHFPSDRHAVFDSMRDDIERRKVQSMTNTSVDPTRIPEDGPEEMDQKQKDVIKRIGEDLKVKLEEWKARTVTQLDNTHDAEIKDMQDSMDKIEDDLLTKLNRTKRKEAVKFQVMERQYEAKVIQTQDEMERVKAAAVVEQDRLASQHAQIVETMRKQHEDEISNLVSFHLMHVILFGARGRGGGIMLARIDSYFFFFPCFVFQSSAPQSKR